MAKKKDLNELAKSIVDMVTGEIEIPNPDEGKNPAAVALGRLGGKPLLRDSHALRLL